MVAILYQSALPPMVNGIQKPMKPGGYSDSGADIAYELFNHGIKVITPVVEPQIDNDLDWVFPDTVEGIQQAVDKGAKIIWLNTVLYDNHPIQSFFNSDLKFVGQDPRLVEIFDDKWFANNFLKDHGISIPSMTLIANAKYLKDGQDISYPVIIKPIRGRGSQGVFKIDNANEFAVKLGELFSSEKYGSSLYAEQYLSGQEITVTVMPSGKYTFDRVDKIFEKPWCLPPVKRFNHQNGVAPYNGTVAVVQNSSLLEQHELNSKAVVNASLECAKAGELIGIKAPIRIDCRADENGKYFLFDVNMKPNMTGPSRPHRNDQDSLSLIAAKGIGWSYIELLLNMLNQSW
ncbi:ATP-grasp domain-containing protein [Aureibacter tunicatorum]|uniref:ATP-grasp domain-containing protein n=1 Tax=Aureibacter tunicatorum TaxID=866807 RepID=A0AAE4BTU3_9BACT|nr:ATP-grasp domain-containing protein [Aureibacter tunicatorum]MDR6240012.1 hypothetical protein [Aureibacter tunicatorum]BDD04484.1 hypothetical protein AUTU_19670 [Aureibacter tunicatorum]